jgi:hypothetical protein
MGGAIPLLPLYDLMAWTNVLFHYLSVFEMTVEKQCIIEPFISCWYRHVQYVPILKNCILRSSLFVFSMTH